MPRAIADWIPFITGALDVALVYFLIYYSLRLVRGTRAGRMLLGLGIVGLVYIAAREFHLPTIGWILGNFLGSVILVIVILFQDDFRRMLIRVGLVPGLGGDTSSGFEHSISEISQAASELSSQRVGALIVLSRGIGLDDYSEHAVQLDAVVSHQLLESIFQASSPIHDGAVVIEGDRILAAGVFLPITFDPNIRSSYGTRHRAAIGLTERTDALVVVVSEETGSISLVRDGKVTSDFTEKTIYQALHRLTIFRQERLKRLRGETKAKEKTESADSKEEEKV